jgi:Carboxypeptidase regulatory-like domain
MKTISCRLRRKTLGCGLLSALVLVAFLPYDGFAQSFTGQIVGTVTDQTGGALPGVTITVTNTGTNAQRVIITNETGSYTVPALPSGTYRVEAQLPGFKTQARSGLVIQVNETPRINFVMTVGEISQTVEVLGSAPLIETETASLGQVIDRDKIDNLPLNGRSFLQLNFLAPGVARLTQGENTEARGGEAHINGARLWGNNYILDGVDDNDLANGEIRLLPSIDALSEFKVQTSTFAAEYGRATGGVVNLTTKSGTNEFHGTVFEFLRNDNLDARNFFAKTKPEFKQNQFGGTVGGPVIHNKTFFFFDFEGLRQRTNNTSAGLLPTHAMRSGDFSGLDKTIIDPVTGNPFLGNNIPSTRISPRAKAFLAYFIDPDIENANIGQNTFRSTAVPHDADQYTIRVDHRLTDKQQFFGRYTYANDAAVNELTRTVIPGFGDDVIKKPQSISLFLTSIWSNNIVGESKMGYSRSNTQVIERMESRAKFYNKQLGLTETQAYSSDNDLLQKFPGLSISGYDTPTGNGGGFARFHNNWHFSEAISWTVRDHAFKFGTEFRREGMNLVFPSNTAGSYTFNQSFSGDNFADFLLGYMGSAGRKFGNSVEHERGNFLSAFWQDDWKVTSNLTINYGVRYDVQYPLHEIRNLWRQWDFATGELVQLGVDTTSAGAWNTDFNNIAPRFGFAWNVGGDGKTVVRGGGGVFYDVLLHNYPYTMFLGPPSSNVETVAYTQRGGQFDSLPFDNPFPDAPQLVITPSTRLQTVLRDSRNTYNQRWSLGVQRSIHDNVLLDVSYVGSHALRDRLSYNANQPLVIGDSNSRPYPQVGQITTGTTDGQTVYNSLQTKLEQRSTGGLSYIVSYTWSKNIGVSGGGGFGSPGAPQDSYNRMAGERGLVGYDRTHLLSINYLYELPLARNLTGPGGAILRGWQLSGIITALSGQPLTIKSSRTLPGMIGGNSFRPDLVCDPTLSDPTPQRWFNTDCFAAPGDRFGTAGISVVRAPGFQTWDLSLVKNNGFGEGRNVQLRLELFNAFNHANFLAPNVTFVPGPAGSVGSQSTNFATINQAADARQIQLGLKFFF